MRRLMLFTVLSAFTLTCWAANPLTLWLKPKVSTSNINPDVLQLAKSAYDCAILEGATNNPETLTIIDYSMPATQKRLWVIDTKSDRVLYNTYVAHGEGSGNMLASRFSNTNNSHASSLGLYKTANPYKGQFGYSLRLIGLDYGYNDNALSRAVVVHGSSNVSDKFAKSGKMGRTWGCPAVPQNLNKSIINTIKNGNLLFAYYPDTNWLKNSRFLHCSSRLLAKNTTPNKSA